MNLLPSGWLHPKEVIRHLVSRAIRAVRSWLEGRKPSSRFSVIRLSGRAVLIWTRDGNVILSDDAAKSMVSAVSQVLSN